MATHYKSGSRSRALKDRNFVPGITARHFALCRPGASARNGMTSLLCPVSRYNAPGSQMVQGPSRIMRTILAVILLCTAFAAGKVHAQSNAEPDAEDIARGKALTEAGGCASCHTADPAKPFAGGKRIDTPFGGIYTPNLTPDRETGLGAWSDDDFYRALRFGVSRDGSRYYPAFPYPNFSRLTRQDILAIRAYLATLAPVSNASRGADLRWPFNYRVVMRGWNWLFFKPGILMPDQQKSTDWNRGRYLVEGVAHCGACHTPKNIFGADKRGRTLGGGRVAACSRRGWTTPSAAG